MSTLSDAPVNTTPAPNGAARRNAAKGSDEPKRGTGDYVAWSPTGELQIFPSKLAALEFACPPGAVEFKPYGETVKLRGSNGSTPR